MFRSQLEGVPAGKSLAIHSIWLVDIRPDGKIAFRTLPPLTLDSDSSKARLRTAASFKSDEFSLRNLAKLKRSLGGALVAEGLFSDEAQALLNTWELSYFKSAGERVFFLSPRPWTDSCLPLELSIPAELNRVMVGRIELVTPEQRENLRKIGRFSPERIRADTGRMCANFYSSSATGGAEWKELFLGKKHLADVVSVPEVYKTYLALGRFRNALVLDQAKRFPAEGLTNFVGLYGLQACRVAEPSAEAKN